MAYNKITLNGETKIDLTQDTVTAGDVALGKTFHLSSGEIATGTHTTQLQEKTVTPTKSVQEVTPDASYDGLGKVNVNPIPSEYIVPTGTKAITSNGTHAVTEYANVEVNVAGEEPNLVTKEITENGTYNASDDGADGYSSVTVNVTSSGGGGGGAGFDPVFANNTPEQISKASAIISYNNMTSAEVEANFGWKIGDTISYQLTTGENVGMRIVGFNHDDKSDGSGKAGITLDMTHVLPTRVQMNNSASNSGGYPKSLAKTTLLPSFKASLPQEWQNAIKVVTKKSMSGGMYPQVVTSSEDLFFLSDIEVALYYENTSSASSEGTTYEYWADGTRDKRMKPYKFGGTSNKDWVLRSCVNKSDNAYVCVDSNGRGGYVIADTQSCFTTFAFCI